MSKKRRMLRVVLLLAVAVLSLKLTFNWLEKRIAHTRSSLIAAAIEGGGETKFRVPKATSFEFVVGVPRPGDAKRIRGALLLLDGAEVVREIRLEPDNMVASTWLDTKGHLGLIVGRNDKTVTVLDESLAIGKTYSVKVDFAVAPPKNTQLWLFYQQREVDRSDKLATNP